jgi:hypothetical protein
MSGAFVVSRGLMKLQIEYRQLMPLNIEKADWSSSNRGGLSCRSSIIRFWWSQIE